MNKKTIVAAVCGIKNSGKTTLIEALITKLNALGKQVAVIKHDGHDFHCDIPGTDTYRCSLAGAYGVIAYSENRTFMHRKAGGDRIGDLTALFPEADVILVEGLKDSPLPKIELVRSAVSSQPVSNPEGRFLIVSDLPAKNFHEACVSPEDTDQIVRLILLQKAAEKNTAIKAEMQEHSAYSGPADEKRTMNDQMTHFDEKGQAIMVDVTMKSKTDRTAVAKGRIRLSEAAMKAVLEGTAAKGDVLSVARIAGIMAVKKTSDLIPLCHPLPVGKCSVDFQIHEDALEIESICTVALHGQTGVEMEALTGVSVSLLTIYDMCKAIDKRMEISGIHLARKSGGKSGEFINDPDFGGS